MIKLKVPEEDIFTWKNGEITFKFDPSRLDFDEVIELGDEVLLNDKKIYIKGIGSVRMTDPNPGVQIVYKKEINWRQVAVNAYYL